MASDFMYLHGKYYISDRDSNGYASNFKELPSVVDIELNLETSKLEHIDKSNAIASTDLSVDYMVKGSGKLTIDSALARVFALMLFGSETAIAGGSFSATAFEKALAVVGDTLPAPGGKKNLTSIVVTDSNGTPATLTLGTHYEIVSAAAALIKFLNLGSFTQPFKIAGTEAPGTGIGIFKQRTVEKYGLFDGINVADDDSPAIVEFYRMQLSPTGSWKVMGQGDAVSGFEVPFALLKDTTKPSSATFGQFGRYVEKT